MKTKAWHSIERYEDSAVIIGLEFQPWFGDGSTYVLYVVDKLKGYTTEYLRRDADAKLLTGDYERFVIFAMLYQDYLKGCSK